MPPLIKDNLETGDDIKSLDILDKTTVGKEGETKPYVRQIVWRNVIIMGYVHVAALYGLYLTFTSAKLMTTITAYVLYVLSGLGITAGAHRLWSHRAYKARFPLRMILMSFNSMAFQNHIYEWSRDHRVHHKFSETDADPHNALRGFFFSHVGWLLCRKHPEVFRKGKTIDVSDLLRDPIVRFQKRHYLKLVLIFCFIIPTIIPMYLFGETFLNSFIICALMRYCITLNSTWFVNSAAHLWGNRPYDKNINPSENIMVTIGAHGEGFHNYHHTFPWDYAASEFGTKFNISTLFIDAFAKIGWAYDCKVVSPEMIANRKARTGENSGHHHHH